MFVYTVQPKRSSTPEHSSFFLYQAIFKTMNFSLSLVIQHFAFAYEDLSLTGGVSVCDNWSR